MVTTGRFPLLKTSVRCYLNQTYACKELVIISQGDDDANQEIADYLELLGRDDIQFVTASKRLSLGAMRNLSIECTTGEVICQWDDDDWSHDQRISAQLSALRSGDNVASAYSGFLKYFSHTGELYVCSWERETVDHRKYLCGTVMFPKTFFFDNGSMLYPEAGACSDREEDFLILKRLVARGKVVDVPFKHHYGYVFHGTNTYDDAHHRLSLDVSGNKTVADERQLKTLEPFIRSLVRQAGVNTRVVARSLTSEVFTIEPSIA